MLAKFGKWKLALYTLPFVIFIIIAKYLTHIYQLEFLTLNNLFTAIISANVFLIGFLISGTLGDYKESERLPGELAGNLQALADEAFIIYQNKKSPEAKEFIKKIIELNGSVIDWFFKRIKTEQLYHKIFDLNEDFLKFEPLTQANFIVRMKQEQNILRRSIARIHTIRETNFLGTGYAVAEIITTILVFGLIFLNLDPFHEKMFFTSFVSFILIYMIFFIKDLDNPFGYAKENSMVEEVSLKPLYDSKKRLENYYSELENNN